MAQTLFLLNLHVATKRIVFLLRLTLFSFHQKQGALAILAILYCIYLFNFIVLFEFSFHFEVLHPLI